MILKKSTPPPPKYVSSESACSKACWFRSRNEQRTKPASFDRKISNFAKLYCMLLITVTKNMWTAKQFLGETISRGNNFSFQKNLSLSQLIKTISRSFRNQFLAKRPHLFGNSNNFPCKCNLLHQKTKTIHEVYAAQNNQQRISTLEKMLEQSILLQWKNKIRMDPWMSSKTFSTVVQIFCVVL